MATVTGLAVASNYYAQPLLHDIGHDLHLTVQQSGLIVTVAQLGYALGLIFLLPLGDLLERRRLLVVLTILSAAGLACVAVLRVPAGLFAAVGVVGVVSVVAQILVPYAATLAAPGERGRTVGLVMSGLLLGILLARTAAGYLAELGGWRTVYAVAAVLLLAAAAALARWLPRDRHSVSIGYPALLRSVTRIIRDEPVLRVRMVLGALSFGAFSVLWTSIAFLLSAPPYGYSAGTIGAFGLVGAAGALAASMAGRFADRGRTGALTGATTVILALSWLPILWGATSLAALIAGIVLLDLAAQGLHITNQHLVYALAPEARSRLNSAYMTAYFAGGAAGSALASVAFAHFGWPGTCALGGAFGLAASATALAVRLVRPRQRR
ncbi:MAG TPA: MFS transporter [Streptosporangiaceae bacterium]|jgi:predicted MFS family arabinose efflux permease